MQNTTKCKEHDKDLTTFCEECNEFMCYKCISIHRDKGCKCPFDITTYAERFLLPKFNAKVYTFEKNRESIESSIKDFAVSSEEIMKKLVIFRQTIEELRSTLDDCIKTINIKEGSKDSLLKNLKSQIFKEYEEIKNAIKNEDMIYLMDKIKGNMANNIVGIGDCEKRLIESIKKALNSFIDTNQIELLNSSLKEFKTKCQLLNESQYIEVTNRYIYGICKPQEDCKILCRYDIERKKLTTSIKVPQGCTISQIGKFIYISGGFNPYINTLNEYIDESKALIEKEPMIYARYCHSIEFTSTQSFVALGGFNSNSLAYCEEYSIPDNKWLLLPSLNIPRECAATALIDNTYLYAIGGNKSNNSIEFINMSDKKLWQNVNLTSNDAKFDATPEAIAVSDIEILIFCGGKTDKTAIYNTKSNSVTSNVLATENDYYQFSGTCVIGSHVYVMGISGHIHIYDLNMKNIEDMDYSTIIL